MEQQGSKLLKVVSIIMIVGGILGAIIMIIAGVVGGTANAIANQYSSVLSDADNASLGGNLAMMWVGIIIGVIGSAVEIFAGFTGLANWTNPAKAQFMTIVGYVIVGVQVVSIIFSIIAKSFSPITLVTGFVLPVLYIVGAMQLKKQG